MEIISVIVALLSSIAGAICGIGGGVIIKPVMDAVTEYSAATINFISSATVLCMSGYSIARGFVLKKSEVHVPTACKLGVGAAIGGVVGKLIFEIIKEKVVGSNILTAIQAIVLLLITIGTLLYTFNKKQITTRNVTNWGLTIIIGLALGLISSFLGIGGGPMNLPVLYYFFSMKTKEAAQNSLFIIVISQFTSLLFTVANGAVPANLPVVLLIIMSLAGVVGGIVGRVINKQINSRGVEKLFILLLSVIVCICIYNFASNI